MRSKMLMQPRLDAPLPLWMIFPVIFAALYASHFTLLRLPYYWDEAGYYIPAAWDFFRTGSLIPITTLTNAHPPLPSIYLALWWKLSGFYPEVTREAVLMVASLGLLAVWRLAMRLVGVPAVAFWTVVLTGLYPIWFAQSTLAHADIFAAACTLWGLVYALPGRDREWFPKPWAAALWFAAAALSKETAIAIPLTLAAVSLVEGFRVAPPARMRLWREAAWLASCVLPLAGWYAWHYAKTGFLFGNPEFLRYNAQATLSPLRILAAFGHRVLHLTAHMNLFVPVLMTVAALLLDPRQDAEGDERAAIGAPAAAAHFSSAFGQCGALQRAGRRAADALPAAHVSAGAAGGGFDVLPRVPYWQGLAAFSAAAFVLGLFVNPPYGFAPEDNLAYAHVVRLHQAGIAQLNDRYSGATVLTAWPMTRRAEPAGTWLSEAALRGLSGSRTLPPHQIARAAAEPEKYSAALVFSTQIDPQSRIFTLGSESKAMDERYFGLHHDLPPEEIARELGGTLVWKQEDQGQWIALIRFNRQFEAALGMPDRKR